MVKVFVGGFPLDMEEMQLAMLFAPHGDISTLKIVRDKKPVYVKGTPLLKWLTEPVLKTRLKRWMELY